MLSKLGIMAFSIILVIEYAAAFTAPNFISYAHTPLSTPLWIEDLNADQCTVGIEYQNLSKLFQTQSNEPKGVVLLAHGINQFSSRPDLLAKTLAKRGYHVLRMSFSGHRGKDREEFKRVNLDVFLNDLFASYLVANTFAQKERLPLYFIGYSLGGLMIQNLINKRLNERFEIKRMLLLAPAITIRPSYKKFSFLQNLIPHDFEVPMPPMVRSSQWQMRTTIMMAGLKAGNLAIDENERLKYARSNLYETLILIDPKDVAVPVPLLKEIKSKNNLRSWRIETMPGQLRTPQLAHYLVEKDLYTKSEWSEFILRIDQFFNFAK